MDIGAITSIGLSAASIAAGFTVGRRGIASQTVELLQTQVDILKEEKTGQAEKITMLEGKVEVLESLVTQRAAVEEVRLVVERIAVKVGA